MDLDHKVIKKLLKLKNRHLKMKDLIYMMAIIMKRMEQKHFMMEQEQLEE